MISSSVPLDFLFAFYSESCVTTKIVIFAQKFVMVQTTHFLCFVATL